MNPSIPLINPGLSGVSPFRVLAITTLIAIGPCAVVQADEGDYDRLWSRAELFSDDSAAVLKNVVLSGRFQVDQANVDSGDAAWSDLDLRRFRFGAKLRLFESFTFHTEAEFDPQGGDLGYERLTDTYVQWSPSDALALTVGKHGVAFTMDGQTSSKQLLAIDRSNLSNNIWFTDEYISGISVSGEMSQFVYNVGVFTSGAKDRGFGDSNGGEFVLATIGRDFGSRLSANEALLRFNYVDNEPDPNNSFTRSLEKIASLNFSFERDRWGVRSDVSSARGYLGQSDLVGLMVMPFLNLSDKKQLVFRYTLLDSDDPNGVRFARYERELASGRGDDYREFYAGFNYYWYGHKLKLQTGLTYADMSDIAADGGAYTGWSWTTGFRVSW